MTKREFYVAIANGEMTDELKKLAAEYIEKMDAANEERKNKMTKKQKENEALKATILETLTDEPQTATTVGEKVEISTQKASALLRQLVADGMASVTEVKVTGKGKQKGYTVLN